VRKQFQKPDALQRLIEIEETVNGVADWSHEAIKAAFEALVARTGRSLGDYVHPTRLALTGKSVGPRLFELAELLGKETCIQRLSKAGEYVQALPAAE